MEILPAIDLRGGWCVRLRQGRFDDETVFDDDPVAVARRFEDAGAAWLHMVDLDGARSGAPVHLDTVRAVAEAVGLRIELGGGIRTREAAEAALEAGLDRVIVGTRAVRDPDGFADLVRALPGRVALGLDARGGKVAVDGWAAETAVDAADLADRVRELPLAAIVYTDIRRDGMMTGPDIEATRALASRAACPVIASGGVTTVEDVAALREAGIPGAIIGRALYEGTLTLEAALKAARGDA